MADGPSTGAARRTVAPVVLVGLMGSGKSTVGRRLASRLDRPFVDADDELVRRTGRTVREWFAEEGEPGFRVAEAELVADLLAAPGPAVIAAGGGAVVTPSTRALLTERALVVWLRAGVPFLVSRARRKAHRPLLDDDPATVLARLEAERTPLYEEVADVVVDVEGFHHGAEKPKRALAARVAELVLEAEAEAVHR
ncbi:shikimate kinase [Iamia majanohamensis]|uniref:Shikimate kinase n=1 Tax=Iamia majanohamensis TaxID=467976 RepID=A0AAE9YC73_9ACTN|nr:shikimate kinase [Iamia majanohamensis]WCO65171.1 shikimate kinase [Iamia majanohamensis]